MSATQAQTTPVPAMGQEYPTVTVQDKPLEFRQFEKVEITGSSIIRKEQTLALPVQVITRREIEQKGHSSVAQAVQSLSSVFNGLGLTQNGMRAGGFSNGALHGMPSGTLVLLNGKRIAPYGIQQISGKETANVDLESVPLAAVDRLEILSDGASSLYGTDAIAGVINIITRTDRQGVEMTADYSRPHGGVGDGWRTSLSWGRGQLKKDGFSMRVTAEAEVYEAMSMADRPVSSQGRVFFEHAGQAYRVDSPSLTAFTSPVLIYSPTASDKKMWTALYQDGQCSAGSLSYDGFPGGCKVNLLPTYDLYPSRQSHKLHASGEVFVNDKATFFMEALYSQQSSEMGIKDWSRISGRVVNQAGAVGYAEMVANGLNPASGIYYFQPNLPALQRTLEKTQWRGVLGLKGEVDEWDYQAHLYQTESHVIKGSQYDDLAKLGLKSSTPLPTSSVLMPLDGQNPLTAQLLDTRQWKQEQEGRTQQTVVGIRASKPVMEINGKDVLLGVGMESRREKVATRYDETNAALSGFSDQRRVMAAHGELQIPVTPLWDVIASLRHDHYSDVGGTTNGKLASRLAFNSDWAVRGSWGTGFRAPAVGQTVSTVSPFVQTVLSGLDCTPELTAVANALSPTTGSERVLCRANNTIRVYTSGNPDLKPESSQQMTLGMAFTPTRNFSIAADYWRVEMKNTLQFESWTAALANPTQLASQFIADPKTLKYASSDKYYNDIALFLKTRNLGASVKQGVDIDVRYRNPGEWGRWLLGLQATYMIGSKEKAADDAQWVSDLAAYSAVTNVITPRWRSQWSIGLEQADIQWQMVLHHTTGYTDKDIKAVRVDTGKTENIVGRKVAGFMTADVMAIYKLGRQTHIRWGVNNITNNLPPLSFYSSNGLSWGANSQNDNLLGRTVQLGITHKF